MPRDKYFECRANKLITGFCYPVRDNIYNTIQGKSLLVTTPDYTLTDFQAENKKTFFCSIN